MSATSTMSIYDQIKFEGKIEGKMEVKREVVLKSFECCLQIELISNITGFTESEIQDILKHNNRLK